MIIKIHSYNISIFLRIACYLLLSSLLTSVANAQHVTRKLSVVTKHFEPFIIYQNNKCSGFSIES